MSKKSLWDGEKWVKGEKVLKETVAVETIENKNLKININIINTVVTLGQEIDFNKLNKINTIHHDILGLRNFIDSKCSKKPIDSLGKSTYNNKIKQGISHRHSPRYNDFKIQSRNDIVLNKPREKTDVKLADEQITKLYAQIIQLSK